MQAILALEDGRIFRGESYGAKRAARTQLLVMGP